MCWAVAYRDSSPPLHRIAHYVQVYIYIFFFYLHYECRNYGQAVLKFLNKFLDIPQDKILCPFNVTNGYWSTESPRVQTKKQLQNDSEPNAVPRTFPDSTRTSTVAAASISKFRKCCVLPLTLLFLFCRTFPSPSFRLLLVLNKYIRSNQIKSNQANQFCGLKFHNANRYFKQLKLVILNIYTGGGSYY